MNFFSNHIRVILLILGVSVLSAQKLKPVTLSVSSESDRRAGEVINLSIHAELDKGWHIWGIYNVPEGPIPTTIETVDEKVKKAGQVGEPEPVVAYDEGFETDIPYHEKSVTFTLPVLLEDSINPGQAEIMVSVQYQTCNERICLPPKTVDLMVPITIEAGSPRSDKMTFMETTVKRESQLDIAIKEGILSFILLSLSMGFLALLTPCVFPMIPITVSFFTHQGEKDGTNSFQQAFIYTFGIIGTFSVLGLLLAATLGASGANQLAANPWVNLFIGGLFIYFALSLFGMYEIQLPESFRRFSTKQEGRGGYVGTLFMAFTFTLTSFTCTVQFVGLLLVAASQGQWFWPLIGMIVFSTAFATPFFFLALFPQYLAKMPQSGGWLNSVKVVMGFLEMAAAFKFFSNTDLVWNWGFFTHNSVLAAWTIIAILTGFYILGKIRLPHDSHLEAISVPRLMMSMFFLTFGLYLGTGLIGQPIHGLIISYLPPSVNTQSILSGTNVNIHEDFEWHQSLDEGLKESQLTGDPVFIDFTGYTCTNCRWMEANVFPRPEVKKRFDQFVLVQLFTDGGENYREKQKYEIERFGTAALPYYVLLTPEDEVIAEFPGMTRDVNEFISFLDKAL
ncbi:MAG: cytochrome c biogenesis protein CcdA [Candidatus Marinimicrobia bacterium]|nr:cytochrome c biogenesis protein CcdA [Candidatus Neomarinimicrobiota bacterium]